MDILYCDDFLIAVNKPSGVLSIQDGYNLNIPHIRQILEPEYGKLWVVHRLDKETSGILLFARNPEAHSFINKSFTVREVHKTYLAAVYGTLNSPEFTIDQPLLVDGDRKHRTIIDKVHGKPAITTITLKKTFPAYSSIQAQPLTGYTHQIRTHLDFAGHAVIGDRLYTNSQKNITPISVPRLALHAAQIRFPHPISKDVITISAPVPEDILFLFQ